MWTCYNRKNQTSCQLLPAKIEEWTPLSLHHNQSRVHEALQKSDAISTYARVILISVYIHRKLEIMLKHQLQRPSSKGPSGCEPRPIGAHKCSVRDKWWQTMHPSSKLNSLRCISMVIAWGTGLQVVHSGHTWGGWIPFIEGGSDGNQGGVATWWNLFPTLRTPWWSSDSGLSLELKIWPIQWTRHAPTIPHPHHPGFLWAFDSLIRKSVMAPAIKSVARSFRRPRQRWLRLVTLATSAPNCRNSQLQILNWQSKFSSVELLCFSGRAVLSFCGWKRLRPTRQPPWKPKPRQRNDDHQSLATVLPETFC